MTIVEFLAARLDADEAAWRDGLNLQTRPDFSRLSEQMLADVDAKRRIIDRCEITIRDSTGDLPDAAVDQLAWATLRDMTVPYVDHPDHDSSWAPTAA